MPLQEKVRNNNKAVPRQRPAKPRSPELVAPERENPPEQAAIRKARSASHLLSPRDVLQLRRTVGNRAMAQILVGAQRQTPASQSQPMQQDDLAWENDTGLPDNLRAGIENLSGTPIDDVRVHYNSSKPSEVQALAYTQGTDIHVAPGQESSLAHEAWHVVQQKQGRVQPTLQVDGVEINDDQLLETEADKMGEKATRVGSESVQGAAVATPRRDGKVLQHSRVVQRQKYTNKHTQEELQVVFTPGQITIKDEKNDRGFVTYLIEKAKKKDKKSKKTFFLKTIDTKSGKAPTGSGALLIYYLALLAHRNGYSEIKVPMAARTKTGFYLHMGFKADPGILKEMKKLSMPKEEIERKKHDNLLGKSKTLIKQAGISAEKHWIGFVREKTGCSIM